MLPGNGRLQIDLPIATDDGRTITGTVVAEIVVDQRAEVRPFAWGDSRCYEVADATSNRDARLTVRDEQRTPRVEAAADDLRKQGFLLEEDALGIVERARALPWPHPPRSDIMISKWEAPMAQLVVRNLEPDVKRRLKRRADRHGQSMEEEVRDILRNAVRAEESGAPRLGSRLRARFAGIGLAEDLPEIRGQKARPATFKK